MRRTAAGVLALLGGFSLPACGGKVCGSGTRESDGTCVPELTCGAGLAPVNGQCVALLSCGSGTVLDGGVCAPDPRLCGPGTVPDGGVCTLDPSAHRYDIRIGATEVPANGYSKIPVTVIGTDGAGAPLVGETLSLGVDQSFQGSLSPAAVTLGPLGAQAWFIPCNSALVSGCTGPARLTVAHASTPATVLARSSQFALVTPDGVGSPAPCQIGGNVVFFDGDSGDYIHPGTDTIQVGSWGTSVTNGNYLTVGVTPSDSQQGLWWDLTFSSAQLGQPLGPQVYEDAERAPFASPGHPGIDIDGDGRGCNTITGRFQVFDFQLAGSTVKKFTATFEQHCEGGTPQLRGCVHYEQ